MTNCPKCGDPIQKGETFCGKCGNIITAGDEKSKKTTPAQNVPATPAPAQTITPTPEPKKKRKLWPIFLATTFFVLLVAIIGFLFIFGVFGKGATIKKYVQSTEPNFSTVVEDINKLEKNLTYESTAETEEEIKAEIDSMKKEINNVDKLKEDVQKAKNNLGVQKTVKDTADLHKNLNEFYDQIDSTMTTRKNIVDYFYQTQILAEKMVKASGATEETGQAQDLIQIADNLYQFKIALDTAIAEFEMVEVPEELKELHTADIDMLKKMSKNLGDMVTTLKNWDDVGFTSAYNRFESTLNEYDTKISKQYLKKLDEEFGKLNNVLNELNTKKDAIEDDYSSFKGKYRIEGAILDLLKNL
jgi:cell division protein FtsB